MEEKFPNSVMLTFEGFDMLKAQLATIQAQLVEAEKDIANWRHNFFVERKRLAEAEGALKILSELGGGRSDGNSIARDALSKLNTHTHSDYVVVKREDLEVALCAMHHEYQVTDEVMDRLKAALKGATDV